MEAQIHVMSPHIPPRITTFLRVCKKVEEGLMAVADVSVYNEGDNVQRLPSGLLVKRMGRGKSQVVWVERAQYNRNVVPEFHPAVPGFSAKRFLSLLQLESVSSASCCSGS